MARAYFMTDHFFHYTKFESALRIIESLSLKSTYPEELNDPFECAPLVIGKNDHTSDELEALFQKNESLKTKLYDSAHKSWEAKNINIPFERYFRDSYDPNKLFVPNKFSIPKEMGKHLRLISGSKKGNILPMWTHYASDKNSLDKTRYCTGVVIEFDLNSSPFEELSTEFGKHDLKLLNEINYQKERIDFDWLKLSLNEDQQLKKWIEIASAKDKSWAYEEEVRIVIPTRLSKNDDIKKHFPVDSEGNIYLLFSCGAIKGIYCGINMPEVDYRKITRLVKSRIGFEIPLIKTRKSIGTYDLWPFTDK